MHSSTERLIRMLTQLGKRSVKYCEGEKEVLFFPADAVQISPSFFRSYICRYCGWCCSGVTLDWPVSLRPTKLFDDPDFIGTNIYIQDHVVPIWRIVNDNVVCKFLTNANRCAIHEIKPFSCKFELFKVRMIKRAAVLLLTYPSRKWIIRNGRTAQCEIIPATQESFEQSIEYLIELNQLAAIFGIDTWLPETISILKGIHYPNFPKEKIIVGENKETKNAS